MPAHTSNVAAANSGEGSISPLSMSSLYDTPISTSDAANSASDSGKLVSRISSFLRCACRRSISFARATVSAFNSAAVRKMAANTMAVFANASAENTNAKPPASATSAWNSALVSCKRSCDSPMPTTSPAASEAAPAISDSSATIFTTSPVLMPKARYTPNSRLRRLMRKLFAYTTRNTSTNAMNTDTPPMTMPSRSNILLCVSENASTPCWAVMELNA